MMALYEIISLPAPWSSLLSYIITLKKTPSYPRDQFNSSYFNCQRRFHNLLWKAIRILPLYQYKINSKRLHHQRRSVLLRSLNPFCFVLLLLLWIQHSYRLVQQRYSVEAVSSSSSSFVLAATYENTVSTWPSYARNRLGRGTNHRCSSLNALSKNLWTSRNYQQRQRHSYRNDRMNIATPISMMILPSSLSQFVVGNKYVASSSTTTTKRRNEETASAIISCFCEWLIPLVPTLMMMNMETKTRSSSSSITSCTAAPGRELFKNRREGGSGWISSSSYHHYPLQQSFLLLRQKEKQSSNRIHDEKSNNNHNRRYDEAIYIVKMGLAGGIAGAVGTAILYPFDSAKTLRQSSPKQFKSVLSALQYMLLYRQDQYYHHIAIHKIPRPIRLLNYNYSRVYKGLLTSVIGAIPSSALYFGTYETSKAMIRRVFEKNNQNHNNNSNRLFYQRLLIHGCSAACGNIISSAIFVPKELIKQKMQYIGGIAGTNAGSGVNTALSSSLFQRTIKSIIQEKGILGLYCGYKAVLIRNIPTAAIRFCLYEELRRAILLLHEYNSKHDQRQNSDANKSVPLLLLSSSLPSSSIVSCQLFVAGAMAGAVASGIMTPVDVIKTRLATGALCSIDQGGILGCVGLIIRDAGWQSLYAGAGSRIFFSAAFSGIGFGTFEIAKKILHVNHNHHQ